MNNISRSKILFTLFFTLICFFALQIPFTRLLGSNVNFTLFDFIAPGAGAFIGTVPGILAVLLVQLLNVIAHNGYISDIGSLIRIFPTLFAVFYFSRKRTADLIIPVFCMVIFNLNPVGRSAWQYSLFWLIPIAAHFYRKNTFVRSLGATFTAHAVGGALWVWVFGLTREMWLALIPQVMIERLLMATGISVFYLVSIRLFRLIKPVHRFFYSVI